MKSNDFPEFGSIHKRRYPSWHFKVGVKRISAETTLMNDSRFESSPGLCSISWFISLIDFSQFDIPFDLLNLWVIISFMEKELKDLTKISQ